MEPTQKYFEDSKEQEEQEHHLTPTREYLSKLPSTFEGFEAEIRGQVSFTPEAMAAEHSLDENVCISSDAVSPSLREIREKYFLSKGKDTEKRDE